MADPVLSVRTLASGSSGNLAVVRSMRTPILLDLGVSSRRGIARMLAAEGFDGDLPRVAVVSHSHTDHLNPSAVEWCMQAGISILAGPDTIRVALERGRRRDPNATPDVFRLAIGTTYLVGDIEMTPFEVPHDVPTLGFVFSVSGPGGRRKIAVATDLGCTPDELVPYFADSDAIVLEANYNEALLRDSGRHPWDKARVASPQGHLSNRQAGRFLRRVSEASARPPSIVLLVHLSHDHNRPDRAIADVQAAIGPSLARRVRLAVAPRREPGPRIEV